MTKPILLISALGLLTVNSTSIAQKTAISVALPPLTYADIADLSLASSITAEIRIRSAETIKGALAAGVPPSQQRYVITADVVRLIRGQDGLAPRITYVFDAPRDSRGQLPKLKKAQMILFAVPVSGRPAEVRLIAPDAQIPLTPENAARVRAILSEANKADAPPRVTGIGDAFHVAGELQGEGETQIFLTTNDGRPMSFNISRRQGTAPTWSVSSGEIVDENAPVPARNSLLWYRLACFVPQTLPAASTAALSGEGAQTVAQDYRLVVSGLGLCPRSRLNHP
jgi:hypothetical protein